MRQAEGVHTVMYQMQLKRMSGRIGGVVQTQVIYTTVNQYLVSQGE